MGISPCAATTYKHLLLISARHVDLVFVHTATRQIRMAPMLGMKYFRKETPHFMLKSKVVLNTIPA